MFTPEDLDELSQSTMFMCVAQSTPDGDLVPNTFTISSMDSDPEEALSQVLQKISSEMQSMGLDHGSGSMACIPITSWQEFADLGVSDRVKTRALVEAITRQSLNTIMSIPRIGTLWAIPWSPLNDDELQQLQDLLESSESDED